jgi:hypothetical protein
LPRQKKRETRKKKKKKKIAIDHGAKRLTESSKVAGHFERRFDHPKLVWQRRDKSHRQLALIDAKSSVLVHIHPHHSSVLGIGTKKRA